LVSRPTLGVFAACCGAIIAGIAPASLPPPVAPSPILWAWERPEDLRFAGPGVTIAVLAGSVTLSGDDVLIRPRLQPAKVLDTQRIAGVVHLEVDRTRPLPWTDAQRTRTITAVLSLLSNPRFTEAQIDFEVPASRRQVLLDLLTGVRAGLPPGRHLSMTALASWCDTETWIDAAPVDEIVPMLFRMGAAGEPLKRRLATGGDFHQRRCRTAIGVATDTPLEHVPAGRRVWVFNPRSWTDGDLTNVRDRLHV
jgi:hypothetical protein